MNQLHPDIIQPVYPTQHQFAPVKDLREVKEIEQDEFKLTCRSRGLWAFDYQVNDDEFVGYIESQPDGTFLLYVIAEKRIHQLTHWRFNELWDAMKSEFVKWMKRNT